MATKTKSRGRRAGRFQSTAKPSGSFHPRVVAASPERFGIIAVDCAKARDGIKGSLLYFDEDWEDWMDCIA